MNSLLLPITSRKEESEDDRKVAVILTMIDVIERVAHIKPDEREVTEPSRKRQFDPEEFEEPIPFIDDLSYSEEKAIKRMSTNSMCPPRKVTFSDTLEHRFEIPPPPPPSTVERTLEFMRKVGRFLCITEPDDEEFEEEEEPFIDYKSYGFR